MPKTIQVRVSAHRVDNSEIPESVLEIAGTLHDDGRREIRLPQGYTWPDDAVYAQVHVQGDQDPMLIILDTSEEGRARYHELLGY